VAGLHRVARRYRNCARSYTVDLLDPETGQAFAEVRHNGEGVIVHLRREGDQWRMNGLFGPRNKRPSPEAREHVLSYLDSHGIDVGTKARARSEWESVRRFAEPAYRDFGLW